MGELQELVFSLEHPSLSAAAIEELSTGASFTAETDQLLDAMDDMLQTLWQMTVAAVVHGLWCWRVHLLFGEPTTEAIQRDPACESAAQDQCDQARRQGANTRCCTTWSDDAAAGVSAPLHHGREA